ncbi:MAG: hypothetical protein V1732_04100 [Patescibacteria group bacterium]
MNILILPAIATIGAFLLFLLLSKKNKDGLSAVLLTLFGVEWVTLMAIMLYNEVVIPQEWWKLVILFGILMFLILGASFESFEKIPYNPKLI